MIRQGTVRLLLLAGALVVPMAATAQTPAAPPPASTGPMIMSAQEIMTLANAGRAVATAGQAQANRPMFIEAPYRVQVEHRVAGTPPSIHEAASELLVVIEGEGIATLGGELVDAVRRNPTTMGGTSIRGGASRPVAKGDFIWVPKGVAHGFTDVRGTLVMTALHLPVVGEE